jgi:hypothetical protein
MNSFATTRKREDQTKTDKNLNRRSFVKRSVAGSSQVLGLGLSVVAGFVLCWRNFPDSGMPGVAPVDALGGSQFEVVAVRQT